jgi:hypothetical protein
MKRAIATIVCLAVMYGSSAFADGWEGEVGYMTIGDSDIDVGALYGFVGYGLDHSDSYSSTFEIMAGFGIDDDSATEMGIEIDVELDSMFGLGYKGTFKIDDSWSVYYRAMYAQVDISADAMGISLDMDESDFGASLGVTYKMVTVSYINFFGDIDADGFTIAYKF